MTTWVGGRTRSECGLCGKHPKGEPDTSVTASSRGISILRKRLRRFAPLASGKATRDGSLASVVVRRRAGGMVDIIILRKRSRRYGRRA